ncbi:hypothetical protein WJX84_004691 [Apatococcus fuscideae]|uniref:BAR domain-containing protein n=1 Tax=Apatococcus fuscideae TaxID=2026836 RepID=A0AAW1TGY7_9CHLO
MGWGDRFKEKMRQGTHISKDLHHFKGTDNDRVKQMLKEADDFAARLKSFLKHVDASTASTAKLINSTHKTMTTPLPRVYEREGESNKAVPTATADHSSGSIRVNELTAITQKLESDLKMEVYAPIDRWLDVHKEFSGKLSQLENRRLEFDNARRLHGRAELVRLI